MVTLDKMSIIFNNFNNGLAKMVGASDEICVRNYFLPFIIKNNQIDFYAMYSKLEKLVLLQ